MSKVKIGDIIKVQPFSSDTPIYEMRVVGFDLSPWKMQNYPEGEQNEYCVAEHVAGCGIKSLVYVGLGSPDKEIFFVSSGEARDPYDPHRNGECDK